MSEQAGSLPIAGIEAQLKVPQGPKAACVVFDGLGAGHRIILQHTLVALVGPLSQLVTSSHDPAMGILWASIA